MTTKANKATLKVLLQKRVILAKGLIFEAERELDLPIQPFVGLTLYNTEWCPPGCDESEDGIKEIAYDLKTGRILCYLPIDDFREEDNNYWTEERVRQRYRAWTLHLEEPRSNGRTQREIP